MTDRIAVISSDTDWAEEQTVREAHELLASFGKPITYYVTKHYVLQDERHSVPVEFGPHPNFAAREPEPEMDACMGFSPGAVSFRAHSLHFTERLRPILRKHQVRYSSSAMMYLQPGIRAFDVGYGLTEVPLFWMDTFHMEYCQLGGRSALDLPLAALEQPGLKVLDIHPVHLALNTESTDHYARSKHAYHDPAGLRRERNTGRGMRDLFVEIVRTLDRLGYEFKLVRDVAR